MTSFQQKLVDGRRAMAMTVVVSPLVLLGAAMCNIKSGADSASCTSLTADIPSNNSLYRLLMVDYLHEIDRIQLSTKNWTEK